MEKTVGIVTLKTVVITLGFIKNYDESLDEQYEDVAIAFMEHLWGINRLGFDFEIEYAHTGGHYYNAYDACGNMVCEDVPLALNFVGRWVKNYLASK